MHGPARRLPGIAGIEPLRGLRARGGLVLVVPTGCGPVDHMRATSRRERLRGLGGVEQFGFEPSHSSDGKVIPMEGRVDVFRESVLRRLQHARRCMRCEHDRRIVGSVDESHRGSVALHGRRWQWCRYRSWRGRRRCTVCVRRAVAVVVVAFAGRWGWRLSVGASRSLASGLWGGRRPDGVGRGGEITARRSVHPGGAVMVRVGALMGAVHAGARKKG